MQPILKPAARRIIILAGIAMLLMGAAAPLLLYGSALVPGLRCGTVSSGSMEPDLMPGDLVYFVETEFDELAEGDVVVFEDIYGTETVHRVMQIDDHNGQLITKGDANDMPDQVPVSRGRIRGVVIGHIARQSAAGVSLYVLRDISGFVLGCGLMLLVMACVSNRRERR